MGACLFLCYLTLNFYFNNLPLTLLCNLAFDLTINDEMSFIMINTCMFISNATIFKLGIIGTIVPMVDAKLELRHDGSLARCCWDHRVSG